VGAVLRAGPVRTLELRASMVIGEGSTSWRILRDLAMRLPVMVLPAWLQSRTRPVAVDDVVVALRDALELPLAESAWFDLPGPETLTLEEMLRRVAALRGRRIRAVRLPVVTPRVSALWLKLVTRADFPVARELAVGLTEDLLPRDEDYWELTAHGPRVGFDEAARRALAAERDERSVRARVARIEEAFVGRVARVR
jgi:uncharacterized protein YbjT (DUF2867 family)